MGLIRTILFFLLGFIVMPILFAIIVVISLMFLLNNVGINDMFSVNIMIWILRGLLLIILFKVQKTIAVGYLCSFALEFLLGVTSSVLNFIN